MSLDKNSYSLFILKGIEAIQITLDDLEMQHENMVERIQNSTAIDGAFYGEGFNIVFYISFVPKNKALKFNFDVYGIKESFWGGVQYCFSFNPQSESDIGRYKGAGNLQEVIHKFENWVRIVSGYNNVKVSKEDTFLATATDQFYEEFKIVDDDADTNPFSNDQQFSLYKFLDFMKQKVEESMLDETKVKEILDDIKFLQESLASSTKKKVIKCLANLFAKTKALSIKLLLDIFDVAKKEIIKKILYGGLEEINNVIHKLH